MTIRMKCEEDVPPGFFDGRRWQNSRCAIIACPKTRLPVVHHRGSPFDQGLRSWVEEGVWRARRLIAGSGASNGPVRRARAARDIPKRPADGTGQDQSVGPCPGPVPQRREKCRYDQPEEHESGAFGRQIAAERQNNPCQREQRARQSECGASGPIGMTFRASATVRHRLRQAPLDEFRSNSDLRPRPGGERQTWRGRSVDGAARHGGGQDHAFPN